MHLGLALARLVGLGFVDLVPIAYTVIRYVPKSIHQRAYTVIRYVPKPRNVVQSKVHDQPEQVARSFSKLHFGQAGGSGKRSPRRVGELRGVVPEGTRPRMVPSVLHCAALIRVPTILRNNPNPVANNPSCDFRITYSSSTLVVP